MEDKKVKSRLFAVNKETGKEIEIGNTALSIPEVSPGGRIEEPMNASFGESVQVECMIVLKTIKKKRFKKLLMSYGFQRNQAEIIHQEYMKLGRPRTKIGMLLLITALTREFEPEFEVQQKND